MIKKLLPILSACVLLVAACEKPDNGHITPGPKDDPIDTPTDDPKDDPTDNPGEPLSKDFLSATETVSNMGAGWNLGNTLDSNSGNVNNMWIEGYSSRTPADYEKAWGQVPATRELMHMLRQEGFRAIRVPVTWYPHMGKITIETKEIDGEYRPTWDQSTWTGTDVDPVWMARVKEVVDYVLAEDMYCILNVHHDTGTSSTHWVVASEESYNANNARFKALWQQIAETFKDYDGRLVFEGYNEMTDSFDSWCFASYGSPARYDAAAAAASYKAVNSFAQDFVDVVRATGGNNAKRNLCVNTYACCNGEGTWNNHLIEPVKEMKLPNDSVEGHLMFQVHYYPTFYSLSAGKSSADALINVLKNNLISKGAPVIVGEWGSGEVNGDTSGAISYNNKRSDWLAFSEYFVSKAKENGIATFHWMGISDGQDRAVPQFTQKDLADAIVKGAK